MLSRTVATTILKRKASLQAACASVATTHFSTASEVKPKDLITAVEGVHQTMRLSKSWRNKPLFRRQGDVRFKTGLEAANLLVAEARRRDPHESLFLESVQDTMQCLSPIFERNPRYAFLAKQLLEPERFIQFRVAWIDDMGVIRMTRGYRIQYSSSLGPYEGSLHFGHHITGDVIKSIGFDTVFSNAVTGYNIGAAVGGADVNPFDKSDAEIQRFCQAYMTELAKYVGPDLDHPTAGMGVGDKEMGYLFGQYKRLNIKSYSGGVPFLESGDCSKVPGAAIGHFAHHMLQDKNDSLEGKRCLIIGAGKAARSLAEKLISYGAIPLSFSDSSGHVYEPDGFDQARLRTLDSIKNERGSTVGRYIIASTTAKFNDGNIFDIPCDLCFPCGAMNTITGEDVANLADAGCQGIIEGGHSTVTPNARKCLKRRGLLYGPHTLTMTGASVYSALGQNANDENLSLETKRIYDEVKKTAKEFNARGDLYAGSNIAGFLRVATEMLNHGAV